MAFSPSLEWWMHVSGGFYRISTISCELGKPVVINEIKVLVNVSVYQH